VGHTSFFFNIAAVIGDFTALSRAKKMVSASAAIPPNPVGAGWD
jgi:hypothetical protein